MQLIDRKASFILLQLLIMLIFLNPVADLLPSYIQILVFIIWLFFASMNTSFLKDAFSISWINIIVFIISLLRCIIADQLNTSYYSSFQVVISRYQLVVYPIIFMYVIRLNNTDKRKIFNLFYFCITITVLFSLFYIFYIDPQAIRNTQRDVTLFGVGDFIFIYSLSIAIGPIFFLVIRRLRSSKFFVLYFLSFILILVCIVLSNLVTSVIVSILSLTLMYIINYKKIIFSSLIPIISVCLFTLKKYISQFLKYIASKQLFYWSTNNKILAISNLLAGDYRNLDTLSRRKMLAEFSIESFRNNLLFGINWKDHKYGVIGCHMQWADDLGRYGVVGNFVIFLNYVYMIYITIKRIDSKFVKSALKTSWLMFFILGFLNPCISSANLMIIFVIIPSMTGFFEDKGEINGSR